MESVQFNVAKISRCMMISLCVSAIAAGNFLLIDDVRMLLPTNLSKITDEKKADVYRVIADRKGQSKIPELLPPLPVDNFSNQSNVKQAIQATCSFCTIVGRNETNYTIEGGAQSNLPTSVAHNASEDAHTAISAPTVDADATSKPSTLKMNSVDDNADVPRENATPVLLPLLSVINFSNKSMPKSTTEVSCCAILGQNKTNHAIVAETQSNLSNNVVYNRIEDAPDIDTGTSLPLAATEVHFINSSRLSRPVPFPPLIHSKSARTPGENNHLHNTSSIAPWTKTRKNFLSDIVVLMTTGSYLQNCSTLPLSVPCPPDRADLVELATNPTRGWLRGIKHIVVSNHPWPPLGVRGITEISIASKNSSYGRNYRKKLARRRRLVGQAGLLKDKFHNEIIIHGVLLANDTFGDEGFKWIVGGDDDTIFIFSKLVPFLRSMDSSKPLFIGVPGPGNIGRWYCADQMSASRARRGPVCCSNFSEPCPVFGLNLPNGSMNGSPQGQSLDFFREDESAHNTTAASNAENIPFNHCCGANAAHSASSLVLRTMQCTNQTCCGIEHGTRKHPKKAGAKEKAAAAMAAHLHWPAGHFAYGGGGWLISNGIIGGNGNNERAVWEMCSGAVAGCPTVAADVALSTCIFNLGFTLGVAPPYIFPGTSGEKRSALARIDELPSSTQGFATQTPGTFVTASIHHVNLQFATHAISLDEVLLRGDLDASDQVSSDRALRKIFWAGVRNQCKCQPGQNPQEMAIRGTGCVPSNCGKKQNLLPGKGKGACCRCTENQWRAIFSPRCSWLEAAV
jgi:hypothetical protein